MRKKYLEKGKESRRKKANENLQKVLIQHTHPNSFTQNVTVVELKNSDHIELRQLVKNSNIYALHTCGIYYMNRDSSQRLSIGKAEAKAKAKAALMSSSSNEQMGWQHVKKLFMSAK